MLKPILGNKIQSIKSWLRPHEFRSGLERARDLREPTTGEWLFTESQYQAWYQWHNRDAAKSLEWTDQDVLWVHGELLRIALRVLN
jgi:hypothetical protein